MSGACQEASWVRLFKGADEGRLKSAASRELDREKGTFPL